MDRAEYLRYLQEVAVNFLDKVMGSLVVSYINGNRPPNDNDRVVEWWLGEQKKSVLEGNFKLAQHLADLEISATRSEKNLPIYQDYLDEQCQILSSSKASQTVE